jgi:hypothetical protein
VLPSKRNLFFPAKLPHAPVVRTLHYSASHTSTGIDWDLLEQKHLEPPYKPERAKMLDELVPYPSFEALMHDFGKADWLDDPPAATEQKFFSNWYAYVRITCAMNQCDLLVKGWRGIGAVEGSTPVCVSAFLHDVVVASVLKKNHHACVRSVLP